MQIILQLEALECLSTATGNMAVADNGTVRENPDILPRIFGSSLGNLSRWLSNEVSSCLVYQIKLDLAMQYVAKLVREHPGWQVTSLASTEPRSCSLELEMSHPSLLESFEHKLDSAFSCLKQKFTLMKDILLDKVCFSYVTPDYIFLLLIRNASIN